jgi:hypothetical protein
MRTTVGRLSFALIIALALFWAHALPAAADTIAYSVPLQAGNQVFGGALGLDFDVNKAIYLTGIGVFDPNAVVGTPLAAALTVSIYNRDLQQQIPGTVKNFAIGTTGPLTGANLIADIIPVLVLAPGHYSVVAWGYNRAAQNGNANIGPITSVEDNDGGVISFVGLSRFGNAGAYPTYIDSGPSNRYLAGTFTYEPVPEPSTFVLLAPGLIALARKFRKE